MDRLTERVSRTATCPHPWESLRFGLRGMFCAACTATWDSTPAARTIQQAAAREMTALRVRLEKLELALGSHLGLSCCERCGTFGKEDDLGVVLGSTGYYCASCLLVGWGELLMMEREDAEEAEHWRDEMLRDLARWFVAHGIWRGPVPKTLESHPHRRLHPAIQQAWPQLAAFVEEARQAVPDTPETRRCGLCSLRYRSPVDSEICQVCADKGGAYLSEDAPTG